jgi:predicted transcriptional regulator
MPDEHTSMSDRERALIEQVAQERDISFEEAAEQLAKEALAARVRRGTGRGPARVYDLASRRKH